jgi:hypothetical protein
MTLTNLKAWLAGRDEINTPRARRIRELPSETERERAAGNPNRAGELENQAQRLLDHGMVLRRSLRVALFELSTAIRMALAVKPADCDCASMGQAYSVHPELQPLLEEVNRLQRHVDEHFGRVHRDDRATGART